MGPLTSFDDHGRKVAPQPGPRGRVLIPTGVLCVLGTAWNGDPMVTIKVAAGLLIAAMVIGWLAIPYLRDRP